MPMVTQGLSTLSPASTYPDLLVINNAGQGLNNTPAQIQDGLGNTTNMTISSNYINFDRAVGQFKLDGIPLTASAATLNGISDVASAQYILTAPNGQLTNGSTLAANNGISLSLSLGQVLIHPDPTNPLYGIAQLNAADTGLVVYNGGVFFDAVNLLSDATINIVNPSGTTGSPTFNVVSDTNRQRVNVELDGVFQSQKSQINFIPGTNTGITVVDNPAQNRTDVTISTTPQFSFNYFGSVYASTTVAGGNLNATYNNGTGTLTEIGNGAFMTDGVTPPINSIILVNNQTNAAQNGLYVLTATGSVAAPYVLTRSPNFNSPANIKAGTFVIVLNGTLLAGTGWFETDIVNTVGTDPINFVQFNLTGSLTQTLTVSQAAHGLAVGNVIRINNGGNYVKAQADNQADSTCVVGIVISVIDVNNFIYQYGGIVTALAGLTQGSSYFLSPTTAGAYTTTPPTVAGQVVLPLFSALSPISALWQPKSAIQLM